LADQYGHDAQISIRQNFRLNGKDYYTIFDLPISVTNSIPKNDSRPSCDALNNPMLTPEEIRASANTSVPAMFAPGDATTVQTTSGQGLGNAAASWRTGMSCMVLAGVVAALVV
jgi:hypothetical protein